MFLWVVCKLAHLESSQIPAGRRFLGHAPSSLASGVQAAQPTVFTTHPRNLGGPLLPVHAALGRGLVRPPVALGLHPGQAVAVSPGVVGGGPRGGAAGYGPHGTDTRKEGVRRPCSAALEGSAGSGPRASFIPRNLRGCDPSSVGDQTPGFGPSWPVLWVGRLTMAPGVHRPLEASHGKAPVAGPRPGLVTGGQHSRGRWVQRRTPLPDAAGPDLCPPRPDREHGSTPGCC